MDMLVFEEYGAISDRWKRRAMDIYRGVVLLELLWRAHGWRGNSGVKWCSRPAGRLWCARLRASGSHIPHKTHAKNDCKYQSYADDAEIYVPNLVLLPELQKCVSKRVSNMTTWMSSEHLKWTTSRDFPGNPVVRTLFSQCRGHGFDSWLGN